MSDTSVKEKHRFEEGALLTEWKNISGDKIKN